MAPSRKNTQSAQPSHKKARSSPNPSAVRLAKAIRKARSVNINRSKNMESIPESSSLVSVKKNPISNNIQKKLSKKNKQKAPVTPPEYTEGLKLLKRGCVTMHRILKCKIMHQKLSVLFNAKREPYGNAVT